MLKGRTSKVLFASGFAPSETEYYEEIAAYEKKGPWLILLFMMRTMIPFANGFQMAFYNKINDLQGTCFIEELANNNWTYNEIKEFSVGVRMERCEYYNYDYSIFLNSTFEEAMKLKKSLPKPETINCYGQKILVHPTSIKYNIQSVRAWYFCKAESLPTQLSEFSYASSAVGSIAFGIMGDLFGRRKVTLFAVFIWALITSIKPAVSKLGLIKLICTFENFFYIGTNILSYINFLEICHKKIRFYCVLTIYGHSFGFMTCTYLTLYLPYHWRYVQWITMGFTLCAIFSCWYMPESPRWLINKMRYTKALKVMEEIIGYVPNELFSEGEGEPFVSWEIIRNMFNYLKKRKIKILVLFSLIAGVIGFIVETARWKLNLSKGNITRISTVAGAARIISVLNLIIVYAAFGKKLGLLWTFLVLNFCSFFTICLRSYSEIEQYVRLIIVMYATTAVRFVQTYLPDLVPCFLRATIFGMALAFYPLGRLVALEIVTWTDTAKHIDSYVIFLIITLLGIIIVKVPDTTHADFSSVKLYRV